ncbi:hypothetical protein B0H14DRAFT_2628555 [Mycena olivaceomarginata]|nr:hypothetical protein B0H14DRAFT_2628555 [Mycena olivaceomarginata]
MPKLWRVFITERRPSPKATNRAFLIQDFEIPSCTEDSQWKLLTSARLPLGGEGRGNDFAGMSPIGINKFVRDHEDVLGGLDISARSWVIIDQKRLETSLAFWVNRPWCKKSSTATKPRLSLFDITGWQENISTRYQRYRKAYRKQHFGDNAKTVGRMVPTVAPPESKLNFMVWHLICTGILWVHYTVPNLLAFAYVLCEFVLAMSEKKIDAILTSKAALEHQGTRDGEHVAKIVLPAWNVVCLQQAGEKSGHRKLCPAI